MEAHQDIPKILYKYRDWNNEYHKKILSNYELYLPSTKEFNDPFEGSIPFEYDETELSTETIFQKMLSVAKEDPDHTDWNEKQIYDYTCEEYRSAWFLDSKHIEEHKKDTKRQIEESFGILSLAKFNNNFLMWSHYSNSHTGFCVGFDTQKLTNAIHGICKNVTYEDRIPIFSLFDDVGLFVDKLLFTKSKVWEYEDEFRMIKSEKAQSVVEFDPACITEIILGCRIDKKNKDEILGMVNRQISHCRVYETGLDPKLFGLRVMQIK
jgi:hypothetical protein